MIGLGSTGASKSDLTDGYNNQFATIQIEEKILKLNIYELFPSGSNEKTEPICKYIIPLGVKMKKIIITDLDDTLYDWLGFFIPSFYEMVDEIVNITK